MLTVTVLNCFGEAGGWCVGRMTLRGRDVANLVEMVADGRRISLEESTGDRDKAAWARSLAAARDAGHSEITAAFFYDHVRRVSYVVGITFDELAAAIERDIARDIR